MFQSTLSSTNDLSSKEITLKSLKEEIQLFRQNKCSPNEPLPEVIWNQLHVLLMKHSLTDCARELNLTRIQVERELIVALKKMSPKPSQPSLCPKVPEASAKTTAAFQEIQVLEEEVAPSVGPVSVQNQETRPVEPTAPMAVKSLMNQNEPTGEPSALPTTVGVPSTTLKKTSKEQNETTIPLNYKAAKAFSTKTAVVEIKRPDGMLMAISICTDRFEELLSAFFKGCPA